MAFTSYRLYHQLRCHITGKMMRRNYSTQNLTVQPREAVTLKLDSPPELHSVFSPELKKLINVFEKNNYEFRIVGGAVRDLLMKKFPLEVDCASNATPEQMKEMFIKEKFKILQNKGENHGTVYVDVDVDQKRQFQITTLRIDVATDGRHAIVEFTKDWAVDACRRDFTINTMSLDRNGTIYDYFNGAEDVNRRLVRFLGDPATRIKEDYLRILRYFRFYGRVARYANDYDPETLKAIKENVRGLSDLSGQRIWKEVRKILNGNFNFELIKTMLEVGLGPYVGLPGNCDLSEFNALHERSCSVLEPIAIMASFFKDMNDMDAFNERFNLTKHDRELGNFIVTHREDKFGEDPIRRLLELVFLTKNGFYQMVEQVEQLLIYRGDEKLLNEFKNMEKPRLPVGRYQLLDRGMKDGLMMENVMFEMKKRWFDSSFTLSDKALLVDFDEICYEVSQKSPTRKKKQSKKKAILKRAMNLNQEYY